MAGRLPPLLRPALVRERRPVGERRAADAFAPEGDMAPEPSRNLLQPAALRPHIAQEGSLRREFSHAKLPQQTMWLTAK